MSVSIRAIDPADPRWHRYASGHADATVYQLPGYTAALRDAYRYRNASLAAQDEHGALLGVLPLLGKRGPLTGARMRSLPLVAGGGPLAASDDLRMALLAAAHAASADGQMSLAVHSRVAGLERGAPGVAAVRSAPVWVVDAPDDPEAFLRTLPSRLRRSIRRAERDGVSVRPADDREGVRAFYAMYAETMLTHRSLPRSLGQLRATRRHLGDRFRVLLAEHDGEPIAGCVVHVFNGTIEVLYNASRRAELAHRPNHALYAHVVRCAREEGSRTIDFGYAWPGSSLAEFKQQWGTRPLRDFVYTDAPARFSAPAEFAAPADRPRRTRWRARAGRPVPPALRARVRAATVRTRAPSPLPAHAVALAGAFAMRWL